MRQRIPLQVDFIMMHQGRKMPSYPARLPDKKEVTLIMLRPDVFISRLHFGTKFIWYPDLKTSVYFPL